MVKVPKRKLKSVDTEVGKFWYVDFGRGDKFLRIWVDKKFVKFVGEDAYVEFPVIGCDLIQKETGTILLKKGNGVLYSVRVYLPWFDGSAEIELQETPDFVREFEERIREKWKKKKGWVIWYSQPKNLVAKIRFDDGKEVVVKKKVVDARK